MIYCWVNVLKWRLSCVRIVKNCYELGFHSLSPYCEELESFTHVPEDEQTQYESLSSLKTFTVFIITVIRFTMSSEMLYYFRSHKSIISQRNRSQPPSDSNMRDEVRFNQDWRIIDTVHTVFNVRCECLADVSGWRRRGVQKTSQYVSAVFGESWCVSRYKTAWICQTAADTSSHVSWGDAHNLWYCENIFSYKNMKYIYNFKLYFWGIRYIIHIKWLQTLLEGKCLSRAAQRNISWRTLHFNALSS